MEGDLAGSNAAELRAVAEECLKDDRRDFMIDLSDAMTCDSVGLEALTWLQRECEDRLGLVKLCGLNELITKILELTRLRSRFQGHDTF